MGHAALKSRPFPTLGLLGFIRTTYARFWLWRRLATGAGVTTRNTRTKETHMQTPLTIDLGAHPNLQFRIDAFAVPAEHGRNLKPRWTVIWRSGGSRPAL